MKLNKEDLCQLIGITARTLKQIENKKQLEKRLYDLGYQFKEKLKEGRRVYYIIEQIQEDKEILNNLCKYTYNTNKAQDFSIYFIARTTNDIPTGKGDIAYISNVSTKTISIWDNTLINKDIIVKDGYYYFCIDKNNNTIYQCEQGEYKSFWKNKSYIKAFRDLQLKYISGKITLNQLQLASAEIGSIVTLIENKYYYRIKKYKTLEDNQLYIDTIDLIKKVYGENIIDQINFIFEINK